MLKIFQHQKIYKTTLMAISQQLIVGSSTIFIAKLSEKVSSHLPFGIWLMLFILSLFAAYLPSSFALYFAEQSKFLSLEKYINIFEKTFQGQTQLRSNTQLKSERSAYLSSEAYLIISQTIDFYLYFLGTFSSVLINIFLFGFVLSPLIMFSYVLSVCLSIVGTRMGSSLIQKMTSESQDQKVQMTTYLNFAWDNIIIGNAWNYLLWKNKLKSSLQDTGLKQTRLVLSVEVLSGITTIASLTPVIASVVYLLLWKSDWTMAAVLVATLPRQIQTIQNISTMVQMSFQWASVRSRLDCLNESVRIDATKVLYGTIDWSQLKIHKDMEVLHLSRIEDFMKNLELPGRITISGKNGCGKSTLLSQVKEQLQERAVYLPPHSDLYFNSTQNQNLSTGTKILYAFDEIQKNIKNAVLLLDEWDANLDSDRMKELSDKIESLSEIRTIVEIRHRHSEVKSE